MPITRADMKCEEAVRAEDTTGERQASGQGAVAARLTEQPGSDGHQAGSGGVTWFAVLILLSEFMCPAPPRVSQMPDPTTAAPVDGERAPTLRGEGSASPMSSVVFGSPATDEGDGHVDP
jgi:hypothetical protein